MTDYDTYGTSTHTASELVRLLTAHLEVVFTERESYYRGVPPRSGHFRTH